MEIAISLLLGYLIGSLPSAYILVKIFNGIDIRFAGSGNVGALNAYEVTGSFAIGFSVLVIDILKGVIPVKLSQIFYGENFLNCAFSGFGAVLGHNFSVWIKFYGGRGLATSLGVFAMMNPSILFVWGILWLIAYLRTKNIHAGNIWATVFTPAIVISVSSFFEKFNFVETQKGILIGFVFSISALIFIKHIKPLIKLIREGEILKNKSQHREP